MIKLPPLPYAKTALQPAMSAETLEYHHGKHHATYVDKTNKLAGEAGLDGQPLEDIIRTADEKGMSELFDNAAQTWNHTFFWHSMAPAPAKPDGDLAEAIAASFGEHSALRTAFVEAGAGHFGSGWIWLATTTSGKLSIRETHDGDTLLTRDSMVPLLVCDVWEHAYYLDQRNERKAYLEAWFDKLANWQFAADQFAAREQSGKAFTFPG